MGLKNNGKKITSTIFVIVIIILQFSFSIDNRCIVSIITTSNLVTNNIDMPDQKPQINHVLCEMLDFTCIDNLVITSSTWRMQVRNLSILEKNKEFYSDVELDYSYTLSFFDNGNITFIGSNIEESSRSSEIGYIERSNISSLNKIITSNLTHIHNMKQQDDYLFLFGMKAYKPHCEIYNISSLNHPLFVYNCSISNIDFNSFPHIYELNDCLDYQVYGNYLYHSTIENKLLIFDFSNITNPHIVKEFSENYTKVLLHGNLMYCLTENKLIVFNNSNPLNPVEIADYNINHPKSFCIREDIVYVIIEREFFQLRVKNERIDLLSKYELKDRVSLKFKKILIEKNYALILTDYYITGAFETQTDLFVFDISNELDIDLLYPKIKLSFRIQIFLGYLALFGIIAIPILLIVIVIITIVVRRDRKNTTKRLIQESTVRKNKVSIPSEEFFEKTLDERWIGEQQRTE